MNPVKPPVTNPVMIFEGSHKSGIASIDHFWSCYCCFVPVSSVKSFALTIVTMGLGANEKKQNDSPCSCQLIPGGLAGTGPNGSFFESQAWVDKVSLLLRCLIFSNSVCVTRTKPQG